MKKTLVYLLVLVLITGVATGCGKRPARRKDRQETIPVKVMRVKLRDLDKALEYVGNIKGQDEAIVYPKVAGKIIEKVVEEGVALNKEETIAYIDRDEVGLKFEKAPVESPMTGIVGRIYVDIGSTVTPQTPIALVANVDKVEVNLDIPEIYLPKLSLGKAAEIKVDAYPDEKFIGMVDAISPIVDLVTRTAPIKMSIDNADHRLQSGMFAKVRLVIEEHKNAPAILKEAIIGRAPDAYVYVVEDKRAVLTRVSLGIREGNYLEVLSGVREGDMVVIMGQQRLRDGSSVEAEESRTF